MLSAVRSVFRVRTFFWSPVQERKPQIARANKIGITMSIHIWITTSRVTLFTCPRRQRSNVTVLQLAAPTSGPGTLRWHAGPVEIRPAQLTDETEIKQIDLVTWTMDSSPAPPSPPDQPFFGERNQLADVLVAEADGQVIGYAILRQAVPIPSHRDVLEINGLAVDPAHQGHGAGRRLVEACAEQARRRGARKLTLRVLGINDRARRLYESCGFQIEGVLRDEFYLGGQYVDDVLMARFLIVG